MLVRESLRRICSKQPQVQLGDVVVPSGALSGHFACKYRSETISKLLAVARPAITGGTADTMTPSFAVPVSIPAICCNGYRESG
jgi:hypothetical protein